MTISWAVYIFSISFALMTVSGFILAGSVEKIKIRFDLSGGVFGMIAALGSNAPGISSAVIAMVIGQSDIGAGIIIGSNIFNLAVLLGVSTLIAGKLKVRRQGIIFNGAVAIAAGLIMILIIFGVIPGLAGVLLLVFILVPYVIASGLKPERMKHSILPAKIYNFLIATAVFNSHASRARKTLLFKTLPAEWLAVPSVILIVAASVGMVNSAVFLSGAWGLNRVIVGMLVLAVLTSVPNIVASIKMALGGKGTAVISAALNSNNITILLGLAVPAAIFGMYLTDIGVVFSAWWLIGMTILAILLLYLRKGLDRINGAIITAMYLIFAGVIIYLK